jgi:hypothetical protein
LENYNYSNDVSVDDLYKINDSIAKIIYSPTIFEKLHNATTDEITCLSERNVINLLRDKIEILDKINFSELAMVVVRPEIFFLSNRIIDYLKGCDYDILINQDSIINFKKYWALYNHGLIEKDGFNDFPTRTLSYISGPSKIIVFKKAGIKNLQKVFNDISKGTRGKYSPNTIRGDIVYSGLHHAKNVNEDLYYKSLDPLGIYRAIVENKIPSDQSHSLYEDPFLFYAGAGIHTPEDYEQYRDMGILLDLQSLEKLTNI